MFFEFLGMFAICGVGLFFVFGGMLGNSMPTVIGGAIVFAVGIALIVFKFINSVLAPPVETYSITLSINNTTVISLTLTIVILVIAPFAIRAWLR